MKWKTNRDRQGREHRLRPCKTGPGKSLTVMGRGETRNIYLALAKWGGWCSWFPCLHWEWGWQGNRALRPTPQTRRGQARSLPGRGKYISALKCDPPGYSLCKYMLLTNQSCKSQLTSSLCPCLPPPRAPQGLQPQTR